MGLCLNFEKNVIKNPTLQIKLFFKTTTLKITCDHKLGETYMVTKCQTIITFITNRKDKLPSLPNSNEIIQRV
jgi:predicted transcriptional regulator YheO